MKNNDMVEVIRAGSITVAQGLKCNSCGLVRPFDRVKCICK